MFVRFRFGQQSFQYCYRNLAKWLGMPYFAWRNTIASNEHEVQNVKIDTRQLEDVMIAAVSAAATKAQKRVLLFQDELGTQTQLKQQKQPKQLKQAKQTKSSQRVMSSFSTFSTPITYVLVLSFLLASAFILRQLWKFSKRGSAILLLAFVSLVSQTVLNSFHELQTQQAVASHLNAPPASPALTTLPASAAANVSLYSQFLVQYSSVTGACSRDLQFLSFNFLHGVAC
jgi:hypothetical protein